MQLRKTSQFAAVLASTLLTLSACNAQDGAKADGKAGAAPAASGTAPAATPTATPATTAGTSTGSAGGPIATVNGVPVPQARADFVLKQRTARGEPDSPELRRTVKETLVTFEALAQEATKKGLDKNPDIATQLELAREQILANAYLDDWMKAHPVSDDVLKQEYEKIKKVQGDPKEYKARHILLKTEADAKGVISQLKKGGNFAKLAKEKSQDNGSKAKGGELDWSLPNAYVPPFAEALTKLKKGETTQTPVKTDFGWHVIQLEDMRDFQFPAFEQVKPQLQQGMLAQQREKALLEIRSNAKIEGLEPAPSAPAGASDSGSAKPSAGASGSSNGAAKPAEARKQ